MFSLFWFEQFSGVKKPKAKKHQWIEFLTWVKLNTLVGKFQLFIKLYNDPEVIYVEHFENNILVFIFFPETVFWKFLPCLTWSQNEGQGLNYCVKVASQKFLSEVKLSIFINYFLLHCIVVLVILNTFFSQK